MTLTLSDNVQVLCVSGLLIVSLCLSVCLFSVFFSCMLWVANGVFNAMSPLGADIFFTGYHSAICNVYQIASCHSISITAQTRLIKMFVCFYLVHFQFLELKNIMYRFTKKLQLLGDFVSQTTYQGFTLGPHWDFRFPDLLPPPSIVQILSMPLCDYVWLCYCAFTGLCEDQQRCWNGRSCSRISKAVF